MAENVKNLNQQQRSIFINNYSTPKRKVITILYLLGVESVRRIIAIKEKED
jgi:hypothetical protein